MQNHRLAKIKALLDDKIQRGKLKPQFWKPATLIRRISPLRHVQDWLASQDSLTKKLKEHHPELEVIVLSEQIEIPLVSEAQRLGIARDEEAWVRCVVLKAGNRHLVYARTVIPFMSPQNPWQELQALGNKPLGEVLFEMPSIQRSPFEFSKDTLGYWPHLINHLNAPVLRNNPSFARRSVFKQKQAPLLLTEVFLPGLLEK